MSVPGSGLPHVIVRLEVGFIYACKAGRQVSTASVVQRSFLAAALLIVGFLLYHEAMSISKIIGMLICMARPGKQTARL